MNANNLEINKGDQFIIAPDISASMQATDCPGGLSRFRYMLETMKLFCSEAAKWDPDGVSFYPFGATCHTYRDLQPAEIDTKISTLKFEGATMTHLAIDAAYKEHVEKSNEQTFLMLFTDGAPSDPEAVKKSIIAITNAVKDEKEFRIAFLTVGVRPADLELFLTDLDDNLPKMGAKYDIVDVKRVEEVDFMSAIDGALND